MLFIRDLATGNKIATLPVPVANQCGSPAEEGCGPDNGLAAAVLVDNDASGAGDTIYAGDYLGNVWRFEYSGGSWSVGNNGEPLFVARDATGKRQSITGGMYTVANPLGGTVVIFGTGRYLDVNDADASTIGQGTRPVADTIYGIWDTRYCLTINSTTHQCTSWSTGTEQISGRDALAQQMITSYTPQNSDGVGGYRTATPQRRELRHRIPASSMGWYLDLTYQATEGGPDLLAGERVIVRPDGVLSDVIFNTVRPEGDTCEPGVQNATMVLDSLTGAADYIPVPPSGGYPGDIAPLPGLAGTDTYRGPPLGEPAILIKGATGSAGVPCLVGTPGCTGDGGGGVGLTPVGPTSCSWISPNATNHPAGKPMPCGRISWRDLR